MVFSNRKWISLLSDISRLATPLSTGEPKCCLLDKCDWIKAASWKGINPPNVAKMSYIYKLGSAGSVWKPLLTQKILQQIF